MLIASGVHAAPADFNAIAGYGTEIANLKQDGNEVAMEAISLVSETTEVDGRKRLSFTASLHNTGISYYEGAQIRFEPPGVGWDVQIVDDDAVLPDLPPNSTAVSLPDPIVLIAPSATAETVKAQVLSGQRLVPRAKELWQFRLPAMQINDATEDEYSHSEAVPLTTHVKLVFDHTTPLLTALQPGMLVMETTEGDTMNRSNLEGALTGLAYFISCAERYSNVTYGKMRTTRMVEVISKISVGNQVHLICQPHGGEIFPFVFPPSFETIQTDPRFRGFIDNLRVGTEVLDQTSAFDSAGRDPIDPPIGNTVFGAAEHDGREDARGDIIYEGALRHADLSDLDGLFCTHIPINGLKISNGLTLDGELLLDGMNIGMKVIHRPNLPPKFRLRLTSKVEMNVRVTASLGANNTGASLIDKEKQIASIPGPPLFIPIGQVPVKFQPYFTLRVGVNVSSPMDVVIPFQGSFEAGMDFAWDQSLPEGERVSFEPVKKIKPLGVSKPQLADSLGMTAELWAEGGASLIVNDTIGPYAGLRVSETFSANPLSDPWWNMGANLTVMGGFELRFLGFLLTTASSPIFPSELVFPTKTSGGPPTSGSGLPGGLPPGPLEPAEGGNARWARLLRWADDPSPAGGILEKVRGSAEDFFMAIHSSADVRPPIMRVGPRGDVIWTTGAQLVNPIKLAGTADGGVVVLSYYNLSLLLTRLDGAGNVIWTSSVRPTEPNGDQMFFQAGGLVVRELGSGQIEIFVSGEQNNNLSTLDADPYLMKFDSSGALQWSKRFPTTNHVETVKDMILLHDGNMVLAGDSKGNSDNTPPAAGSPVGGWLMKVTPLGDILWSKRSMAAMFWSSVVEGPDHTLYTCGNVFPFITVDTPAFTVGSHDAEGVPRAIVNVGEAMANDKGAVNSPSPPNPITDHIPNAGLTPYDRATDIAWTPSGLAVCGTTGLGDQRAPFTLMMTEKLSVRWMVTHEGTSFEDVPFSIMPTEEGIVQLGSTRSLGSLNNGFGNITQLMKLPYDGTVPLRAGAIIKYLQPSVYNFTSGNWSIDIVSPQWRYLGNETVTHTTAMLTTVPGNVPGPYAPVTNLTAKRLERGSPSAPMTYPEWADYHQLTLAAATDNSDGDARNNYEEYLFGGDPLRADAMTPHTLQIRKLANGGFALDTVRSYAARSHPLILQFTNNLGTEAFQDILATPWSLIGVDPDAGTERLGIETLPDSAPRRFFRLRHSEPGP